MAKVEKTALELADLIRQAVRKPELRVAVFSNPLGWHGRVYGEGGASMLMQERVDRVVQQISRNYKLAQERR
jgi:hypothetical protein